LYINHKQSTISVSQSVSQLVSQSGLALVVYAIFTFDEYTPFPSFYTLIPTIGAGLILVFSNNKNLVGKLLGSKLFVGVGLISYSAYLWHQPLLVFARLSTEEPSQLLLALVPTSLVLAYFSWKYIELPFRDTTRFGKNKIMIYSLIGSIFFITVGLTGHFTYNDYDPDIDKDFVDTHSYPESENCLNTFFDSKEGKPGKCSTNSTNPKILLVGDSHAGHYYKGITSSNLDVAVIWNGGCYAGATYSENCKSRLQFIKNYIYKNRDTIKVVLLSSYLNLYVNPKNLAKRTNKEHILIYKESDGQKTIVNDISDFILFLKNLNLSVGIIYDIPELSKSPWDCKPHSCQQIQSLVDIIESQSTQRKIYSTLENYYKIKSFDPINILCDNDYCYSVRNDSLLYWDTNHLNEKGSFFLATPLVEWINQNYTR